MGAGGWGQGARPKEGSCYERMYCEEVGGGILKGWGRQGLKVIRRASSKLGQHQMSKARSRRGIAEGRAWGGGFGEVEQGWRRRQENCFSN